MEFNTKKIFVIIFLIIFLISTSVGVKAVNFKEPEIITPPSSSLEDLDNQIEDNKDEENNGGSTSDDTEIKEPVKIYREGYSCVKDALNIFDNSKGFKVTSTFKGITDIMGIGKAVQETKEITIKSGQNYLKETTANCDVSLGANYYRYFYSNDNGNNVEYVKTEINSDKTPNRNKILKKVTTTKENVINNYDVIYDDVFNVRADRKNSTLVKFDNMSNKKYYIVSFMYDINKIPEKYIENVLNEGGLSGVDFTSIKLTYYIEKETLYIRKVARQDIFSITKGITLNVNTQQEYVVNMIDVKIDPKKPEIL